MAIDEAAGVTPPSATPESTTLQPTQSAGLTAAVETTPTTTPASSAPESLAATESETVSPKRTPSPILHDDLRPQTRAEDFLPFFQIPTAQPGDITVVPVPRTPPPLPPSSATYTQTPR